MMHIHLCEQLTARQEELQLGEIQLLQDALLLGLPTGTTVQIRATSDDDYSFEWQWGDLALRIDTAPLHSALATFPNHLHRPDGTVAADPLTRPGHPLLDNVIGLLRSLLHDPLLGHDLSAEPDRTHHGLAAS
ncbi:toxin-antitoxin system TumE family protein [Paludibacterium purpuratum]|uniref:Uncharacterized protein n=1 Tax=Paludibacterium purpuratum TaxID=1144873 RepID=A0A4R7B9M6_9NEIS|nr:DUF6516 family protein [Paludibacterium purpuratum]TDR81531.1 hypothetical protein DFP86_103184 [Paludibacterium purpuratum]